MEREGNNKDAAPRSVQPSTPVIVLPAGSAAARQKSPQHRATQQQPAAASGAGAGVLGGEPPEKVFYKTRLCERFQAGGRCAYEDGCTFAHGHAELRPPLPLPAGARRSRVVMPPVDGVGGERVHRFHAGKVCFEFRDTGTCHFGDRCNFSHVSAAAHPADARFPKLAEPAGRSVTPPARAFAPGSASVVYAPPAAARAFPPGADDAAGQREAKRTRLEMLSRKKLSGIYGDWPEQF